MDIRHLCFRWLLFLRNGVCQVPVFLLVSIWLVSSGRVVLVVGVVWVGPLGKKFPRQQRPLVNVWPLSGYHFRTSFKSRHKKESLWPVHPCIGGGPVQPMKGQWGYEIMENSCPSPDPLSGKISGGHISLLNGIRWRIQTTHKVVVVNFWHWHPLSSKTTEAEGSKNKRLNKQLKKQLKGLKYSA